MKRSYSELIRIPTIEERYRYLRLTGDVGAETFGSLRGMNQDFYHSKVWKEARRKAILRDGACDLGVEGFEINRHIAVHHINPVTLEDILEERWDLLLDPENLICVSLGTHNAIHYGDEGGLPKPLVERVPGDTCPWR